LGESVQEGFSKERRKGATGRKGPEDRLGPKAVKSSGRNMPKSEIKSESV